MTSFADTPAPRMSWLARTESWLDARGKGAWIAAVVLAMILAWPVGLALIAYMIWSNRMFTPSSRKWRTGGRMSAYASSGNSAFDAYKADTLRRLEDEQQAFQEFLQRLREAKDKAEFDQFMNDRASRNDKRDADPIEV